MFRFLRRIVLALALASAVSSAWAFALMGPFATWETSDLGYNTGNLDEGGPMVIGEEYRWNVRTITYGFDKSFLDYFGARGVKEVNKAIAILNNLPPASQMSANLSEFPSDTRQMNYQATALLLLDLKSTALSMLLPHMGLSNPERFTWTLRSRSTAVPNTTNYWVITLNFDPVTLAPTPYVNGILYSYFIGEFQNPTFSDAVDFPVDPLAVSFSSVASSSTAGEIGESSFTQGMYYTGLTRDDVGGLRYIYRKSNMNVETLLPDAQGPVQPALPLPWSTGGRVGVGVIPVNQAVRPGIDKVQLRQVQYYGPFLGVTNTYSETYYNVTNRQMVTQRIQRVLTIPDIIFTAGDCGVVAPTGVPATTARTTTGNWINNSGINATFPGLPGIVSGPGVISGPVILTFTTVGPFLRNINPGFLPGQAGSVLSFGGWAAFDGTTNAPYLFPQGASIQQLEQAVLNGVF